MKNFKEEILELCNYAKKSSKFYSHLYQNININSEEDFQKLPFTTSDMYYENYEYLCSEFSSGRYVFSTGGTTGKPKYIYLSYKEFHLNIGAHGNSYKKAGINKNDRVGIFGIPGTLTSEFSVYLGLEKIGCFILPIGIFEDLNKISNLLITFNINTLLLMPTDVINLINHCKTNNIKLHIDKIITGGEPLTDSMKKFIKDFFGNIHFGSTYQSMDFGIIGYQTSKLASNEFIVNNKFQFLEVIDSFGNILGDNQTGELVVTNLSRKLIPVIRYRTGDIVRLSNNRLFIEGRISNTPKIGGEKFQTDIIVDYLNKYNFFTGRYQYIISKKNHVDCILLKLELSKEINNIEYIKEELRTLFLDKQLKLKEQIQSGAVHDLEFELLLENEISFILSEGTGKIKNLIDRR